jgi:hypothetical protein
VKVGALRKAKAATATSGISEVLIGEPPPY